MKPTRSSQSSIRYEAASILPFKGSDAAEILINDHHTIRALLTQLSDAAETPDRARAFERLKGALTIHNTMEENFVYPALQIVVGKKRHAEHLYHETAESDVLMYELDTMLKSGNAAAFPEKVRTLQSAILEHIEDEEQKLIPDLRRHMSSDQASMLTTSIRAFREGIDLWLTA